MRILHTCATYWPRVDGVAIAMQRISEGLAARGHRVTVATGVAGPGAAAEHAGVRIERFDVAGNEMLGFGGDGSAYAEFVSRFDGDVLLDYAAQTWATDLVFPLLPQLGCKKVFVPCGYSELSAPAYSSYFSRLPARLRQYDRVVHLSACYRDKEFSDAHGLTNGVVIGNGAATEEFESARSGFRELYGFVEQRLFICVANLMTAKGQRLVYDAFVRSGVRHAALVFVGSEINRYVTGELRTSPGALYTMRRRANILRYELFESRVAGRGRQLSLPSPRGTRVVVLTGVPRELVVAAYHQADLFLFGSLVECAPLVILEAMASGTPWVSTPVGNVPELPGGVVIRDAAAMAAAIRRLASRGPEWESLASQGRAAWHESFTWDYVVGAYEQLYAGLLEPRTHLGGHDAV